MSYALAYTFQAPAGLTDLRAQLFDTNVGDVGAAITTGFGYIGDGWYLWYYAGIPDGHVGGGKIYSDADPTVLFGAFSINPQEAENTDEKISAVPNNVANIALSEPGAVFSWPGATLGNVLQWLGALARNKMTQTSAITKLRNDADSADIASSNVSDDGTTFTRGEWS